MINLDEYKSIYIAGPITGMENNNREAFEKAEEFFLSKGKIVCNPHKIVPYCLIEKYMNNEKKLWVEAVKICVRSVTRQDAVFVLEGWNSSRGATVEIFTAQTLNIPVFYYKTMQPMDISFQLIKYPKGVI